jgi:HSP20 family protein
MTDKNTEKRSPRPHESDNTSLALPGSDFPSIFEDFMRPFDEFIQPFFPSGVRSFWTEFNGKEPDIDVQDRGDHYLMTAELPGFEKKDLEVQISENVLELKAERSSDSETKTKGGSQTQSSRSYFHRYMTLPEEVVSEKVTGTMKNGVLELKLPKRAPKAGTKSKRVDLK